MVALALLATAPFAPRDAAAEWFGTSEALMGTRITVRLWHDDAAAGDAAVTAAIGEISRIEQLMSTYIDDSRMSAINREAHLAPVFAGDELFGLVATALRISALTGGAFDITYDSVGRHYDYRESVKPDAQTIAAELPRIDYRHVLLDADRKTIAFAVPGVRINLGGIAKGYAVERAVEVLRERGIAHASVSAGGDSRLLGDRRGQPWVVGIQDPRDRGKVAVRLPLLDEAISTSGDYERFFIEDGERFHHIISPSSGKPSEGVQSATVVGPDGVMTDALSTSVFILGPRDGIALIERLDGYEAIVIDADRRMHYSSGLQSGEAD